MDELTLAVVGIDFPNPDRARSNRRYELLLCVPGEPVELRPEPRNRHDPHAVAVLSQRGIQLGYLSAERAPMIGARLRRGEAARVIFQGLTGDAGYIRIRFGGAAPTLPPPREARPTESDEACVTDPDGFDWGA